MTRIIAGSAKGRQLCVPARGTRPTSDRVREAIFSRLDQQGILAGARVLDLFAGSGALGLEAASRGAGQVTLVDQSSLAVKAWGENKKVVPECTVTGIKMDVGSFLSQYHQASYTLVFVDPPYQVDNYELGEVLRLLTPVLAPEADIVVERDIRSGAPVVPDSWFLDTKKVYGQTCIWYYLADSCDSSALSH